MQILLVVQRCFDEQRVDDHWRAEVGKKDGYGDMEYFRMHGCTSTSKNMEVALGFSQCNTDYDDNKQAVLFVYSISNCNGFYGFRLNSKRYSVYP